MKGQLPESQLAATCEFKNDLNFRYYSIYVFKTEKQSRCFLSKSHAQLGNQTAAKWQDQGLKQLVSNQVNNYNLVDVDLCDMRVYAVAKKFLAMELAY